VRRRLALLLTATAIGLGGGVATAATASADPNPHSQFGQCTSAAAGQHLGWYKQTNGGRNIGGTCPSGL
jgi:hypothetical protein